MKIQNLTVALLVITVILTKNSALGCCKNIFECTDILQCTITGNCPASRALDPRQDEDGGFLNTGHHFGSVFRKLSPLFAPGIQRVLTF